MNLDDYLGAIQDCTRAIALLARYSQAYAVRAEAEKRLRDFPQALADINRSIEIDPTRAIDFCTRGFIAFDLGDFTQAMADSKQSMALNPKRASAYELRGYVHVASTNYVAAVGNFRKSLDIVGDYNYSRFQLWALQWRSGEGEQATQELARHFQSCTKDPSNAWFYSLQAFLVGALSEKALLTVAKTSAKSQEVRQERLCEAMYYAGLKRLLAGKNHAAGELFRKCLSTGQSNACEFMLATQELKRLDQR